MSFSKNFLRASAFFIALITSESVFSSRIDLSKLEEYYPEHFKGIQRVQEDKFLLEPYRDRTKRYDPNPALQPKFTSLREALQKLENPKLESLLEDLSDFISKKKKQTAMNYLVSCMRATMLLSDPTFLEEDFFRVAGFSTPYIFLKAEDLTHERISQLLRLDEENDSRGDFTERTHSIFCDKNRVFSIDFKKSPHKKVPYFMLCVQPGEDIFGYFMLAWTYYQGIHPVPVTLAEGGEALHGIKMSRWGKLCHDLAHHRLEPGDRSVKQFFNNIGNHYYQKVFVQNSDNLPEEQKELSSMHHMVKPISQFAITVYEAYRKSLFEILVRSLEGMNGSPEEGLSPEFEAFSAAAFVHAHETFENLSSKFATQNLHQLLESSVQKIISTLKAKNNESLASTRIQNQTNLPSIRDLIPTSFITGETSLTDQEIFEIVKKRPLREYRLEYYLPDSLLPPAEKEISGSYSVTRKRFYIEVKINLTRGNDYLYRLPTNYLERLNLDHDRQFLLPAQTVLNRDYSFTIPEVPQEDTFKDNEKGFEAALKECRQNLNLGRAHLLEFFLKTAKELSSQRFDNKPSIAEVFSAQYTRALYNLSQSLRIPLGINQTDALKDTQEFLSEAMSSAQ